MTVLGKDEVERAYRRIAKHYDVEVAVLGLLGFRDRHYRRLAVDALRLAPGDLVVDLGCGTGRNLPFLERAVGPRGRIVGVDLTSEMLAQAHERIANEGWNNVELVHADLAAWAFPTDAAAMLSTFAITLAADYDEIIRRAAEALRPGGRLAIVDFKEPRWPRWLILLAVALMRRYAVRLELTERHPWESIRRHLHEVAFRELYAGGVYLSVGERQ